MELPWTFITAKWTPLFTKGFNSGWKKTEVITYLFPCNKKRFNILVREKLSFEKHDI